MYSLDGNHDGMGCEVQAPNAIAEDVLEDRFRSELSLTDFDAAIRNTLWWRGDFRFSNGSSPTSEVAVRRSRTITLSHN